LKNNNEKINIKGFNIGNVIECKGIDILDYDSSICKHLNSLHKYVFAGDGYYIDKGKFQKVLELYNIYSFGYAIKKGKCNRFDLLRNINSKYIDIYKFGYGFIQKVRFVSEVNCINLINNDVLNNTSSVYKSNKSNDLDNIYLRLSKDEEQFSVDDVNLFINIINESRNPKTIVSNYISSQERIKIKNYRFVDGINFAEILNDHGYLLTFKLSFNNIELTGAWNFYDKCATIYDIDDYSIELYSITNKNVKNIDNTEEVIPNSLIPLFVKFLQNFATDYDSWCMNIQGISSF
jgi:hypothetical protein